MKVAVFSTKKFEQSYLEQANTLKHELIFLEDALSVRTAIMANGCEAISVFTNDDVSKEVLQALSTMSIRFVVTRAAGYDNIDLKEARNLKIKVANVPEYSPYSIAEHTVAMILALNRKIIQANQQVKNYNFALDNLIGFDLKGKTVGIIGVGKIGSIVIKILSAFGCKILAYDILPNEKLIADYGISYVSLADLCQAADIISLHAPLNENTKHLIRKDTLDKMKNGVMIVNTGRGGLLHTADALSALEESKIGYLGLDVYENEKGLFFYDHSADKHTDQLLERLFTFKNVLITGHQAFLTENALKNIADATIFNLSGFETENHSKYEILIKNE